jgi:predicted DNA-binding transcriptional regulator AlpA
MTFDGLSPTLSANETASLLGVSYWTLLRAVNSGTCPVEPLRLGRSLRFPTAMILDLLGIESKDTTDVQSSQVTRLRTANASTRMARSDSIIHGD